MTETVHNGIGNLVVGLGKSGFSAARFLAARGETVMIADSRENPPLLTQCRAELPQVQVVLGPFDEELFRGARRIVLSPGVALAEPAVQAALAIGVEVVGDVELFAREAKAPVIAITGSNGKSTVTALVGELLDACQLDVAVGGNIGTPVLDLLDELADAYVLELSSFQLETTRSLAPLAATVLNVSPDHLDRYADLQAYADAKGGIYEKAGLAVVNDEDTLAASLAGNMAQRRHFGFGRPKQAWDYGLSEDGAWLMRGEQRLLAVDELRLKGRHNQLNVMAAMALCDALDVPLAPRLEVLRRFAGLPHRSQWVARFNGVDWINDSKGTNVGATLAALGGMREPVVLIAGGIGKGADFSPLREAVAAHARAVVLIGRDAALIEAAIGGAAPVHHAASMPAAVAQAAELAQPGDVVLLSPACASFDMFDGFEQRGESFSKAVEALAA